MLNLKILRDEDAESPRQWDNLGVMACWHSRYNLGDDRKKVYENTPAAEWLEPWGPRGLNPDEWIKTVPKGSVILPLYLYDHSGITMSTGSFSCPWDSGQVGWIVATPWAIRKNFMVERLTKQHLETTEEELKSEVRVYDQYLTGAVWGFVFSKHLCHHPRHTTPCDADCKSCQMECGPANYETVEDSCWGFFGEDLKETGLEDSVPEEAKPLLQKAWEARA